MPERSFDPRLGRAVERFTRVYLVWPYIGEQDPGWKNAWDSVKRDFPDYGDIVDGLMQVFDHMEMSRGPFFIVKDENVQELLSDILYSRSIDDAKLGQDYLKSLSKEAKHMIHEIAQNGDFPANLKLKDIFTLILKGKLGLKGKFRPNSTDEQT